MIATRYDGLRARTAEPALTAVDLHLEQVATLAVELLFEHLSGDKSRLSVLGPKAGTSGPCLYTAGRLSQHDGQTGDGRKHQNSNAQTALIQLVMYQAAQAHPQQQCRQAQHGVAQVGPL